MGDDPVHDLGARAIASCFDAEDALRALPGGARIAVVGGGPAGALFAYFVRRFARTNSLDVAVDVFEPRLFTHRGPAGCNHCGGIVSESLVQLLATEGINLPPGVVQRGIESYMLHTDVGSVRIEAPSREKRIAAVFRGTGPRESAGTDVASFDRFLLDLAASTGATVVRELVSAVHRTSGGLQVMARGGAVRTYDLVVVAAGINSRLPEGLAEAAPRYRPPAAQRTFIAEFDLGSEAVVRSLGDSMHVFLLDLPRVEFAALIPKGRFVTLCLLGDDVDEALVARFLASPEVAACFPRAVVPQPACHCFPRIDTASAARPFDDRLVWIGDCGVSRLYKDGIGSAYRTAKAAAATAVFHGIAAEDFERHFWPECRALIVDNVIARVVFAVTGLIRKSRFLRRGVLRMTAAEQRPGRRDRMMSGVLWDVFTGSAPYRDILLRTLRPAFAASLAWNLVAANTPRPRRRRSRAGDAAGLGRVYGDRQVIVRQGDTGDCMFAIQTGRVEVVRETPTGDIRVAVLQQGDIFGEMAILENEVRSATVRALGEVRILTIDQKTFMRRVQEDPSVAFNLARILCGRVRQLDSEVAALKGERAIAGSRPVCACPGDAAKPTVEP